MSDSETEVGESETDVGEESEESGAESESVLALSSDGEEEPAFDEDKKDSEELSVDESMFDEDFEPPPEPKSVSEGAESQSSLQPQKPNPEIIVVEDESDDDFGSLVLETEKEKKGEEKEIETIPSSEEEDEEFEMLALAAEEQMHSQSNSQNSPNSGNDLQGHDSYKRNASQGADAQADPKRFQPEAEPTYEMLMGDAIHDQKCRFQGMAVRIKSIVDIDIVVGQVKEKLPEVSTYMWACRLSSGNLSDDDGETGGASEILKVLSEVDLSDTLVFVFRWFGGAMLGPKRFTDILRAAASVVNKHNLSPGKIFKAPDEHECPCGRGPCVILKSKTKNNPNRNFYVCPGRDKDKCSYFLWCDQLSKGTPQRGQNQFRDNTRRTPQRNANNYSSNSQQQQKQTPSSSNEAPKHLCRCQNGFCVVLTSHTSSNPNRQFYKCPLPRDDPKNCGYFKWVDEVSRS